MTGKIVLITGATSGYGLATAKLFKEKGDTVIIASRNAEKVQKTVAENGFADGLTLDVTNFAAWVECKRHVLEKYGRIDVLVNNAGGGLSIRETAEQTREDIDAIIALNLNSVIYGSGVFAEVMKQQKSGIIINISSVCAKHAWGGWSVYAAAKAGVLAFTKGLYVELQKYGVRATCLIPASASTGFQSAAHLAETNDSLSVDDIASAVYYAAALPERAVVEEMTVWGTSQVVEPL